MVASIRMIAKMPTMAAMAYNIPSASRSLSQERARLRHQLPAHVLRGAVRGVQAQRGLARHDRIFILHADHEQNASTSTVRLAGSSAPIRSPASGPAAPRCGAGAWRRNEAALKMLSEIGASSASPNSSSAPRTRTIHSG